MASSTFYSIKRDYGKSLNDLMKMSDKELQQFESKLDTKLNHRIERLEQAGYTQYSESYQKLLKDAFNPKRDYVKMENGRIRIKSERGATRQERLQRIQSKVLQYGDDATDLQSKSWAKAKRELKSVGLQLTQQTKGIAGTMITKNKNFAKAMNDIGWDNIERLANRWLESVGNYVSGLEKDLFESEGGGSSNYEKYLNWSYDEVMAWMMEMLDL